MGPFGVTSEAAEARKDKAIALLQHVRAAAAAQTDIDSIHMLWQVAHFVPAHALDYDARLNPVAGFRSQALPQSLRAKASFLLRPGTRQQQTTTAQRRNLKSGPPSAARRGAWQC